MVDDNGVVVVDGVDDDDTIAAGVEVEAAAAVVEGDTLRIGVVE